MRFPYWKVHQTLSSCASVKERGARLRDDRAALTLGPAYRVATKDRKRSFLLQVNSSSPNLDTVIFRSGRHVSLDFTRHSAVGF